MAKKERCRVCGKKVKVMAFRMTGLCSGKCEKAEQEG